jgi:Domain of unknown function (DUF4136)
MRTRTISLVAGLAMVASGWAAAQNIHTDYDHHANFSQYHTYSFKQVKLPNQLWDQRAKDAVSKDLDKLGLKQVPDGGDLAVSVVGTTQQQQQLNTFYTDPGWGGWGWWGWGPQEATTTTTTYQTGTLVIDMFDANAKRLVFRGTADGTLSGDPQKNEKKLDKAVDDIISKDKLPKPLGNLS